MRRKFTLVLAALLALVAGLVDTIVDMADRLGLRTIAEGVEAQEQYLQQLGVDFVQGWYYSRAIPASELGEFIALRNSP